MKMFLIVMKGHPCTGKSTLARKIAQGLGCPLLDKDDIKGPLTARSGDGNAANALALEILWRVVRKQCALGVTCVVDTTLSSAGQLAEALESARAASPAGDLVVVECRTLDEGVWRRRVQERREAARASDAHKPKSWEDLRALVESYHGSFEYDPRALGAGHYFRVDTSTGASFDEALGEIRGLVK